MTGVHLYGSDGTGAQFTMRNFIMGLGAMDERGGITFYIYPAHVKGFKLVLNAYGGRTELAAAARERRTPSKVKGQHGVKNGPWTDAYGDADVLDYAYQEIITRFSDGPGALLDEIEIPEGYRIISGEKWASDLSGIGREWVDDINPFLLLADKTGELMICDILSKRTLPVVAVRSDFAERFDRLADEDGMIGDKFWTYACIAEARGRNMTFDFRGAVSRVFELKGRVEKSDSPGRDDGKLTVKGEIARAGADKLAEEAKKKGELLLEG